MRLKLLLQLAICTAISQAALSQIDAYQMTEDSYRQPVIFGFQCIGSRSKIENIETTIIPETYFLNYTKGSEWVKNAGAGLFVNFRAAGFPYIGGQLELGYTRQGGLMKFNNTQKDFHYNMHFKYDYIDLNLLSKLYPVDPDNYLFGGLNVGVGLQFNFINSSEKIFYKSGGSGATPDFGSDLEQQQQLRSVLKGRTNLGLISGISYELFYKVPLIVDLRYIFGINDVVETYPNSYNFVENYNNNNAWQIRLSLYLQKS